MKSRILAIQLKQYGLVIAGKPMKLRGRFPQDCIIHHFTLTNANTIAAFIETGYLEDGDFPTEKICFEVHTTNSVVEEGRVYLDTLKPAPDVAFHIFEVLPHGVTIGLAKKEIN